MAGTGVDLLMTSIRVVASVVLTERMNANLYVRENLVPESLEAIFGYRDG